MTLLPPINALGTQFLIEIWDDADTAKLETISDRLEFLLNEFDNNYSRFKPESFISKLNHHKFIDNPTPEFVNILKLGVAFYDQTNGIHNLMVGETLVATGYDSEYSFTPKDTLPEIPNPNDVLEIHSDQIILRQGMIDIGGYGKGAAIDLLATTLAHEFGIQYFLINGGGDMYGTSYYDEPIQLYLEHPTELNTYLGTTTIMNQGFAASSPHKRTWIHDGTTYHHIIDTANSASFVSPDASFIIAQSAVVADVFATVALLATPTQMDTFAEQQSLAIATFSLPATLRHNQACNVQTLS